MIWSRSWTVIVRDAFAALRIITAAGINFGLIFFDIWKDFRSRSLSGSKRSKQNPSRIIEATTSAAKPQVERVVSGEELLRMQTLVRRVPAALVIAPAEALAEGAKLLLGPVSMFR